MPENKVADFIQRIKETYPPYKGLEGDALNEVIFATKPGRGACGMYAVFWKAGGVLNLDRQC